MYTYQQLQYTPRQDKTHPDKDKTHPDKTRHTQTKTRHTQTKTRHTQTKTRHTQTRQDTPRQDKTHPDKDKTHPDKSLAVDYDKNKGCDVTFVLRSLPVESPKPPHQHQHHLVGKSVTIRTLISRLVGSHMKHRKCVIINIINNCINTLNGEISLELDG